MIITYTLASNMARMGVAMMATLICCQSAVSADWAVIQTTSSSSVTVLNQDNTIDSEQAINGVILDDENDDLVDSNQTVSATGNDLSLEQTGLNTNSNVQAVNLASAQTLDTLTQEVSGFNSVQINHNSASGASNVQALNYARSSGDTRNLSQLVNGTSVIMNSNAVGNIQALNYSEATGYSGSLEQTVNLETLDITNLDGTEALINSVQGDLSGLSTPLVQTSNIGTLKVNGQTTVILSHIKP